MSHLLVNAGLFLLSIVIGTVLCALVSRPTGSPNMGLAAVFIIIVYAILKAINSRNQSAARSLPKENGTAVSPAEDTKKCPKCAEQIVIEALVCKHCGHEFTDADTAVALRAQANQLYSTARVTQNVSFTVSGNRGHGVGIFGFQVEEEVRR